MDKFKVIIVEDVPLELKGTEGIFRNEIPEATIIGTADNEPTYWKLLKQELPVLDAGCDGIILKSGELLTRGDVASVMNGKRLVFNQPILEKIVEKFKRVVSNQIFRQEAFITYEIDEYDERFLRHLALGYTKEQITNLRGMPFGVKSLEKRQNELVNKLFPNGNGGMGVNATRLVVRAIELHILDIDNLVPDND